MSTARPQVGILLCGHLAEEHRSLAGGDYDRVYADMLGQGAPDLSTRAYDAINGELPATTDECGAWILTGSPHDAFEDDPWIVALADFARRAVDDGRRVAGVCFGHQLIAVALGGRVERAEMYAVGPHEMEVEPTPWFVGGEVAINAMHRDVVTELPPGARAIATGATAAIPAYVVGEQVLCVQDHPEFEAPLTEALITARRATIGAAAADAGLARLAARTTDGPVVGRWIADFLLDRRH